MKKIATIEQDDPMFAVVLELLKDKFFTSSNNQRFATDTYDLETLQIQVHCGPCDFIEVFQK